MQLAPEATANCKGKHIDLMKYRRSMSWWEAYCSIFPVHTLFSCGDHLTAVAALLILRTTRQGFQGWPDPVCCHTYAFLSSPQVTIRPDLGAQSMDVTRMSCSFKMSLALARGLLLPRPKNQNMKVKLHWSDPQNRNISWFSLKFVKVQQTAF